jgi:peptidoglycan/LPS O-acetylase OafA/YrhL
VVYHCCCEFDQHYGVPVGRLNYYDPAKDRPTLMQLPPFRIIPTGGNTWVAIFFILSGFVCSRNALRLARAHHVDEARKNISRSMIRRVVRLVVPATLATLVCWASTQLGLYEFARAGDYWVSASIPPKVEGVVNAVRALFKECVSCPYSAPNLTALARYLARG